MWAGRTAAEAFRARDPDACHAGVVTEYTKNRLLVATPGLADPNFARSVVLMIEHSDQGALGLILNHPGPVLVESPFPQWAHLAASPPTIFHGGPVTEEALITLARTTEPHSFAEDYVHLFGSIGVVDVVRGPEGVPLPLEAVRIFSGYAGWGAGQLEGEIEAGGWFVVDAVPEDVFTADPARLWSVVLKRQSGWLSVVAACPPDPSTN